MAGAIAVGDPVREFGDVSIDTRTLKAGDLFIAIRGERFDGARFRGGGDRRGRGRRRRAARWSAAAHGAPGREPKLQRPSS